METPGNALMSDVELIPPFELGEHDMFLELTIPGDLFGREKEMQEIRTVIRSLEAAPSGQVHSLDSGSILSRTRKLLYGQSTVSFAALSNGSNVSVGYSNASFGGAGTSSGDTRMTEATVQTGKDDLTGMSGIEDSIGEVGSPARVSSSDSALVKGIPPAYSAYTHPRANASSSTMPPPGSTFAPLGHSFEHHSQSHHSHSLSHTSISLSHSTVSGGSIRNHRTAQAHSIVISGPAGIGKSTLVQMNQAYWRRQGLWGHAKMVKDQASPFTAVLTSLSSVLRQLMMFQSERQVFVSLLRARLGQQIYELPLLYHGVPELRDLLGAFGVHLAEPQVLLSTEELGARFQTLVDIVYSSLADVKPLALVLDDIHFADKSTMELISLLADSKSRMLIMTTCRDDDVATVKKVRRIFSNKNRTTWIDLAPLDSEALGNLVSTTLQRSKEDIAPLARLVARVSCGNPFLARNLLQTVWRQRHIWYEWGINTWQYNLEAIEQTVHAQQLISAPTDISFLVAHFRELNEDAQQCIPLVREDPNREEFIGCLVQAAESSAARGAHELALHAFKDARSLLGDGSWHDSPERTKDLTLKLAELYGSQGNHESSDQLIFETLAHVQGPADRAHALRLRGRNRFVRKDFESAFNDIVQALDALNIKLPTKISPFELDDSFNEVKAKILLTGFDELLELPRSMNPLTDLAVSLMADCATSAFWGCPNIFGMPEYIGIQIINIALTDGVSPGTAQGLFWCLGGASERRHMYRFCSDLAKLGLQMAYKFGSTSDKCRCETLFSAFASGYSPEPIRTIIPRVEAAISEASSAGDRVYEAFARCHALSLRLYCSEHLSDLVPYAEEIVTDIRAWAVNSDTNSLAMGILMTIRALAGETDGRTVDNAFDTEKWKEAHFLHKLHDSSGNFNVVMNWYNSFKISGLYGLGFYTRAAELGFDVYATRSSHPSHRHIRYGLFFHSLAMIQCIRHGDISATQREQYLQQIDINQQYIKAWVSPSPANNSAWHALVQAEMASLEGNPEAFKFYDNAIKIAVNDDWIMEEAWALYLEGSHFLRCGVEGLGSELQARGIARHRQWGAFGIVNHLNQPVGVVPIPFKRQIFSVEAGVQTDATEIAETLQLDIAEEVPNTGSKPSQDDTSILTATDLAAVLRWSQIISSDINLSSSLQRLTEIAIENSGAQEAAFVMKTDEGDYTVVTSCVPPQPCIVFEQPKSIRRIGDPLKRAVLQHCLNSRSRVYFAESTNEPRFAQEAALSVTRSVICVPFSNNRGQTYGALYLGSHYAFSQTNLALLSLLSQQASISIANALLFQSVQQATKANLQMIQFQRQALEEARASKEDAMKATKIKSNFLASMSHELRTPFSSFYGLLDILGGTKLDSNQKELVQTAKQSCELLLKIIDSILDYSKLEASALKLEAVPFLVEDVVADCVELLLPLAAQKLDLSYDIAPDVPLWAIADYSRIRQVLMNLLGNALKFTAMGSVSAICTVDRTIPCAANEVVLKWIIQDTGIGMSEVDMSNLWQPFSQADNSSTRRFGGTGLGLSISLSLVKLMRGDVGVSSVLNVGSRFWFHVPVQIYDSDEAKKTKDNLSVLRRKLGHPRPLRILVSSPSSTTLSLLTSILSGFDVMKVPTFELTVAELRISARDARLLDFLILDHFAHSQLEEVAKILDSSPVFKDTKAIHLYTPTPPSIPQVSALLRTQGRPGSVPTSSGIIDMELASVTGFASTLRYDNERSTSIPRAVDFGRIVRMNKPPRQSRLLELLARLKDIPVPTGGLTGAQLEEALESMDSSTPLKTANVLIAEDNPVANKLLIKQLQKYDLNVVATVDGSEAVREWEKHGIGFFNFALFDHHMPICDGVEAAKRIRFLETRKKASVYLPIVALSADCQESTKELCLSAGMTGFLTKPVRAGDLPNLLRTYGTPKSTMQPSTSPDV
ncbi:hypothetical protein FRC15_009490 [Serendipita sp. 397]|nr:hypothetical protein FRC15_009490 [Serendipita sp. 397]